MKKILLILSFFIIQNSAMAGEIKFVQVTDTHYSAGNEYRKRALENTVNDINSLSNIAFVVFTGDNIDTPNPNSLVEFIKVINKLKVPYYIVIGNHDVFRNNGLSKAKYIDTIKRNRFRYSPSEPNYVFTNGEFVFIVVDGAKEIIPGPNGYYKKETLDWLDNNLSKYKNKTAVILQHFPVVEPKPVKSHTTYKAEEYLELLKKHNNVAAVVSGHYHVNGENMQDGVYHISTPSLLAEPNSYKIIDIVTAKGFSPMIYTELREVEKTNR